MKNITPIQVPQLNTGELAARAVAIRDAVAAKTVTAQQVGSLFFELVEHCGNVRDALALFIETNIPEIQQDIDTRLAGVDDAVAKAAAEPRSRKLHAPWWSRWWLRCPRRTWPHRSVLILNSARALSRLQTPCCRKSKRNCSRASGWVRFSLCRQFGGKGDTGRGNCSHGRRNGTNLRGGYRKHRHLPHFDH